MNSKGELIQYFYEKGFNSIEIGEFLIGNGFKTNPATIRQYVSRNFKHLKGIHDINYKNRKSAEEEIGKLYEKGFNSSEIADKLIEVELDSVAVRKCISRKFKHLKEIHDINYKKKKERKKEDERILKKENDRFMSVREFVMRNTNCYEQQKDGSYVFNGKSGVASWDTPTKYTPSF